jgi:hypothetical protein
MNVIPFFPEFHFLNKNYHHIDDNKTKVGKSGLIIRFADIKSI